jgi:hypothetical protein
MARAVILESEGFASFIVRAWTCSLPQLNVEYIAASSMCVFPPNHHHCPHAREASSEGRFPPNNCHV